ncbi:MAG: sulfotransferase [Pseudomonadota bacterium]
MLTDIICITGAGRSGSTIMDRVLGAIEGVASFNEMHVILKPDYMDKQVCSCGKDRDDCPFWIAVFDELSARHDIARMTQLGAKYDRSSAMPRLMFGWLGRSGREEVAAYAAFTADKFRTLAKHAGADTIIDSSKIPTRALLLRKYAKLPVRTVHLVRHPGAVASSWMRKKKDPSIASGEMTQYTAGHALKVWAFRNLASELLRFWMPYLRLKYETFAEKPRATVDQIIGFAPHLSGRENGFVSDNEVNLPPLHSLSGNPDRFTSGVTEIREDTAWKTSTVGRQIGLLRLLIGPIARRYGYRLNPEPQADAVAAQTVSK